VVAVNQIGAFVDWGLPKNLLVPFREQNCDLNKVNLPGYIFI
jgi:predicted RNA-binding protein (virulence factor B family)